MRFAQRLKSLKTNLDTVRAGGVAASRQVEMLYAAATQAWNNQDYRVAHAALDRLPALIEQGLQQLAAQSDSSGKSADLFKDRLAKLLPEIKAAAGTPEGDEARLRASEAGVLVRNGDVAGASGLLDQVESLLSNRSPVGGAPTERPSPDSSAAVLSHLKKWNAVLLDALKKLKLELAWVVSTKDPLAVEAELELKAVMRQLGGKLESRRQAVELERYIETDDIVAEVCEFAFDLKSPLLTILREIQPQLPA